MRALDGLGMIVTAEAPVAWPSGAFVSRRPARRRGARRHRAQRRVRGRDRLAGADDPPVRPAGRPSDFARARSTTRAVERFLRFYAETCLARGVTPLIENVPPVLRMRTGGVFLSPVGGHWRDLLALARARAGAALHARHLARRALPLVRGRLPDAVRARLRRRARPRALRRGARPARRGRARLGRARPARRGSPVRPRRAGARPRRPAPGRARPATSSRRSTSPTTSARST